MHAEPSTSIPNRQPPPSAAADAWLSVKQASLVLSAGDEAIAHAAAIDNDGVHHFTAIRPDVGPVAFLNFRLPRDAAKARDWVNGFDGDVNIHYTLNEVREGCDAVKPSKADIVAIRGGHGDVDIVGANTDEAVASLPRQVKAKLPVEASTFLSSGGGVQPTFRLKQKLPVAEAGDRIEAINNGIIAVLGGDRGTWNLDRVLRLGGTQNLPDSRKRAKGRVKRKATMLATSEARYSLDELELAFPPIQIEESGDKSDVINAATEVIKFREHEATMSFADLSIVLATILDAAMKAQPKLRRGYAGDYSGTTAAGGSGKRAMISLFLAHHCDLTLEQFAEMIWLWGVLAEGVDYAEQKLTPRDIARLYVRKVEPIMQKRAEKIAETVDRSFQNLDGVDQAEARQEPSQQPKATIRRLKTISFANAAASWSVMANKPLVEGLLDQGTLSVMYGPSNAGKTFVAMDIAFHIAMGRPWGGMPTTKGTILYVAAEGGPGALMRARALEISHANGEHVDFEYLLSTINLLDPKADLEPLIATMEDLAAAGRPVIFLVIDTFSRVFAGGEENGSTDMGKMVTHFDRIRQTTDAHVCIIHHSGKQIAKGSRGHSLLRAATDTEIEVANDTIMVTKQRDMQGNYAASFRLQQVELGKRASGAVATSAVIQLLRKGEAAPGVATPAEQTVLDAINAVAQSLDLGQTDFRLGDVKEVLVSQGHETSLDGLRKHFSKLIAKSFIERSAKGLFRLREQNSAHSGYFQPIDPEEAAANDPDNNGAGSGASVFD